MAVELLMSATDGHGEEPRRVDIAPTSRFWEQPIFSTFSDERNRVRPEMASDNGTPWELAIVKGHKLQRRFVHRDPRDESKFRGYGWLAYYGWTRQPSGDGHPLPSDGPKLAMYHDLGLSKRPEDNTKYTLKHTENTVCVTDPSQPESECVKRPYNATNGSYSCTFAGPAFDRERRAIRPGAIIATASESPRWSGHPRIQGADIVPLQHWADVMFLQWEAHCQSKGCAPHQLRAIIQMDVTNRETIRIVTQALATSGLPLRNWPGNTEWWKHRDQGVATFPWSTSEFQAILATPNGVGPAWFLLGHLEQMGYQMISAVSVFKRSQFGANSAPFGLCFHVEPVRG